MNSFVTGSLVTGFQTCDAQLKTPVSMEVKERNGVNMKIHLITFRNWVVIQHVPLLSMYIGGRNFL